MSYWLPEGLLKRFNLCLSALQQESSWSLRKCDLRDVSWMGDNFSPEEAEHRAEHHLRWLLACSSERWLLWVTPEVIAPHWRLQKGGESSNSAALLQSPGYLYKEEDWDDRPHRKVQLVRSPSLTLLHKRAGSTKSVQSTYLCSCLQGCQSPPADMVVTLWAAKQWSEVAAHNCLGSLRLRNVGVVLLYNHSFFMQLFLQRCPALSDYYGGWQTTVIFNSWIKAQWS